MYNIQLNHLSFLFNPGNTKLPNKIIPEVQELDVSKIKLPLLKKKQIRIYHFGIYSYYI